MPYTDPTEFYLNRLSMDPPLEDTDRMEREPSRTPVDFGASQLAEPLADDADPRVPAATAQAANGPTSNQPSAGQQAAGGPPKRRIKPRDPGYNGTKADWAEALELITEQARREYPDYNSAAIARLAQERYEELVQRRKPMLVEEYAKLMQTSACPPRAGIRPNIEVAALRRLKEWRELERHLLRYQGKGPRTSRKLALAVFERMVLLEGAPQIRGAHTEFGGSNLELDWAFLDSPDMTVNRQLMRTESNVRKALKAMLADNDPDLVNRLNVDILKRRARQHPDYGRYLVVDGTPIERWVRQRSGVSALHRKMLLRDTGAELNYHAGGRRDDGSRDAGKLWNGNVCIVISDLVSGDALEWKLISKGPAFPEVYGMLERLMQRAPWLDPGYLIGDSEFDTSSRLAYDLQARMGIVPVFAPRKTVAADLPYAATRGVPHCSRHDRAMKLVQSENFMPLSVPIHNDADWDAARKVLKDARTRWTCPQCKDEGIRTHATTYFRDAPRIYSYLPHGGDHRRAAQRDAMMLRRNSIEQVFSQLKRRGIGATKHQNCRWAATDNDMRWLIGAALMGQNARRLAHENGLYSWCAQEAWELGLTKRLPAPSPSDREARRSPGARRPSEPRPKRRGQRRGSH